VTRIARGTDPAGGDPGRRPPGGLRRARQPGLGLRRAQRRVRAPASARTR
jgi:hypothetical protein